MHCKKAIHDKRIEAHLNQTIGKFIQSCSLNPTEHPLAKKSARYAFELSIDPEVLLECALYNKDGLST